MTLNGTNGRRALNSDQRTRAGHDRGLVWRWIFFATLIVSVIATGGGSAKADPSGDKSRVDRELQQADSVLENATSKAQQAWADFSRANQQLPAAQQAADEARGQVIAAQVRANETQRDAEAAQQQLQRAQSSYDQADNDVKAARAKFASFARQSYESARYLSSSLVLAAKDPQQVVDAVEYVRALGANQQDHIDVMKAARLRAGERRADVTKSKQQADQANDQARQALRDAQQQAADANTAKQKVNDLVSQSQRAYTTAQREKDASQQKYNELQEESRRIEDQLQQAQQAQSGHSSSSGGYGPPSRSGGFIKPVVGWKSSDYGWRFDPYYHVWQLHAGVDLAAGTGAPIWAAAGGTVVYAGWERGYGNYTCILHGTINGTSGVSTCYGHQSQILVHKGQQVSQGQTIGKVGMTGAATGPHLHFEVRINGAPKQPLGWFPM